MAQNTKLTPQMVLDMSQKHTATADDIESQQRSLANNVNNLVTVNQGAMMSKLSSVHTDWDASTRDIVNQLRTMATTLASVAQRLQSEDEQNANSVNV